MSNQRSRLPLYGVLAVSLCALGLAAMPKPACAQSLETWAHPGSKQMDAILFVQSLPMKNGHQGIELIWIPQPLQRFCLGKTSQQCAAMDFCIRTTSPNVSTCRNLAVPLSRLPSYPAGMIPARQLSIVLLALSPDRFPKLQEFFRQAPPASLQHLSMSARVKAHVRFTRKADDDDFDVLDILAVAPFGAER